MGLQKNKTKAPDTDVTSEEVMKEGSKPAVETKSVTTASFTPPAKSSGKVHMCIQNEMVVTSTADDDTLPLIYAKDGTHYLMAGDEPIDFGKRFTYFPIVVSSYWVMDPGYDLSDEVYEEFKKYGDDEPGRIDKEDRVDRDGVRMGDTLAAAIKAGCDKAAIKRYVVIKCKVHEHEGLTNAIEDSYGLVSLRLAPGSQWGTKGYETMIKGLNKAIAWGQLKGTEVPGLEGESVVLFEAVATNTKFKSGPSYTMSAVKPA